MTSIVEIARECEYRFEVASNEKLTLKLKSGSAEIFGVELAIDNEYTFQEQKVAVYTWYGCTLETQGVADVAYTSDETPMNSYINLHAQLQKRRELARVTPDAHGPRVLVTGPADSGKSTLTQILINYALRLDENPTLVDLDPSQGWLSIPGTIAATPLDINCLSVEESFILTSCLSYWHAHALIADNPELYRHHVNQLAAAVKQRLANDSKADASGLIIDTSNWIDGPGYDLLLLAIEVFQVDVIVVIGQDRLFSRLQSSQEIASSSISIIKLVRSGGVVPFNVKQRAAKRMNEIREYFYGRICLFNAITQLAPCVNHYSFDDLDLFAIQEFKVSDVMLPVGQTEAEFQRLQVVPIEKSIKLLNSIAAVCHEPAQQPEAQESQCDHTMLLDTPAAGFVCIREIHMEEKKMVLLVPSPGPLPSRKLLLGSIKWME